jgi:hypothetical protein
MDEDASAAVRLALLRTAMTDEIRREVGESFADGMQAVEHLQRTGLDIFLFADLEYIAHHDAVNDRVAQLEVPIFTIYREICLSGLLPHYLLPRRLMGKRKPLLEDQKTAILNRLSD